MHKNAYSAKSLIGNWQEERSTEQYEDTNFSNTFLANPSYNKYVPISKDIGNIKSYSKVSYKMNQYLYIIIYILFIATI